MEGIAFQRIATNGITLNVAQAGPAEGKLVILLHGFPEFWYGWRKQIPDLVQAGFLVWAPDQRGYNTSDKPPRVRDYRLDEAAADVVGLIDAAGRERAVVVGHDWGGAAAWWTAQNFPERVEKLVILNVPHPLVMQKLLRSSLRQLRRSWYMFAFQLPWLPEWIATRSNWSGVVRGLKSSSRPGAFTDDDFVHYLQAWTQPGACTGMLNWYRAPFWYAMPAPKHPRISPPTLVLWGAQDRFVGREAAQASLDLCERGELVTFESATHWLPHEEPVAVNRRMIEFLCRE